MSSVFQNILQQVEQNNITEARNMIKAYLKENPRKEQGWVVAFNIFHKKENKVYCLEQIIAINPNNVKAKSLLQKIQNPITYSTSIQTQPKPVLKKNSVPPVFDESQTPSVIEKTVTSPVEQKATKVVQTTSTIVHNVGQSSLLQSKKQPIKVQEEIVDKSPSEPVQPKEVPQAASTTIDSMEDVSLSQSEKQSVKVQEEIADKSPSEPVQQQEAKATSKLVKIEMIAISEKVTATAITNNVSDREPPTEAPTPTTKSNFSTQEVAQLQDSHDDLCMVLDNAVKKKDLALIRLLFQEEAEKVDMRLDEVLMKQLLFKSPPVPNLRPNLRADFEEVKRLSATKDASNIKKATTILQDIWASDIDNLGLRSWMAFLQMEQGNLSQSVQLLRSILRLKDPKFNAFALWNLGVIAAKSKEDKLALDLLILLLEEDSQPKFLDVTMALAVKVKEAPIFFSLLPKLWHLDYYPLAIYLATNYPEETYLNTLSDIYIQQTKWDPPNPAYRFENAKDYKKIIGQAIVSRNMTRLIAWLRARIAISKIYVPDYLALSDVLEKDVGDMEGAFEVLIQRLEIKRLNNGQKEAAVRDLIEFCIRSDRNDLKRAAFQAMEYSYGNREIIYTIEDWKNLPEVPQPTLRRNTFVLPKIVDKKSLAKKLEQLAQKLVHTTVVAPPVVEQKVVHKVATAPVVKKVVSKPTAKVVATNEAYALFIDHENIIKSLEQIRAAYGQAKPENIKKQFAEDLEKILQAVEKSIKAPLTHKVTVSFWDRFPDKDFLPIYTAKGFTTTQPRSVKKANAVDFHLVEEIHSFWRTTLNENKQIRQIVVLTGDGDFSAVAQAAKKEGITMQIWGGRKSFGERFRQLLGKNAFVLLEDVLR